MKKQKYRRLFLDCVLDSDPKSPSGRNQMVARLIQLGAPLCIEDERTLVFHAPMASYYDDQLNGTWWEWEGYPKAGWKDHCSRYWSKIARAIG